MNTYTKPTRKRSQKIAVSKTDESCKAVHFLVKLVILYKKWTFFTGISQEIWLEMELTTL